MQTHSKGKFIKANSILPDGAKLMPVEILKIGSWSPLKMDASYERHGTTWFRVKGGMGGSGDREDWVANIFGVCISVHDYMWREPRCGFHVYKSFTESIDKQIAEHRQYGKKRIEEARSKLNDAIKASKAVNAAIARRLSSRP